jgi:5'-nucleotidase
MISKSFSARVVGALVLYCLAGCSSVPTGKLSADTSRPVEVKLIAFNDFHGNLKTPSLRIPVPDPTQSVGFRFEPAGGVEQFAALVQGLRAKNPNHAVISAGDMVGATPLLSAFFSDEPTIEAMNLIGVDLHGVGNHEFDYGINHLKRLQAGGCKVNEKSGAADCGGRTPFAGAKFQFLAANVIEASTGKTLFPAYAVREFDGVKVAFIGMTLRSTAALVRPGGSAGVEFRDEVATVNALVPELRQQGIEAIVVLIHEGGAQSGGINDCADFKGDFKDLVERLDPAVDVVVSAHTHRYYVCKFGQKLVTSAGSYGTLVTEIDLQLDRKTHDVVGKTARNLVVKPDGPRDPQLTALVDRYAVLAKPLETRVVAKLSSELPNVPNAAGESPMGNLIADAQANAFVLVLARARELRLSPAQVAGDGSLRPIAFNNPGSVRSPLIPSQDGSVTYGDLFKVQPFQNDLISMVLTGAQIKKLLEQQFAGARPQVLGVSKGFSYSWDASRPAGERVLAESIRVDGRPLVMTERYWIVANSFIAGGSDGFGMFTEGTDRRAGLLGLEALVNYLALHTPYSPPPPGERVTRIN